MKVFISLPMHGRTDEEIKKEMERGVEFLKKFYKDEKIELIDTMIDLGYAPRLAYLGRSIQLMVYADLVLFMPGWNEADGCLVEHLTAFRYGIRSMYFVEEDKYGWIF